jgi:hypothetical protein
MLFASVTSQTGEDTEESALFLKKNTVVLGGLIFPYLMMDTGTLNEN